MAKIIAPNNQYTGVSASVSFMNGQGETNNPALIDWFRQHGYIVEEEETEQEDNHVTELDKMDAEQLKAYAVEHGIDIGQATSVTGILKKITEPDTNTGR
jgi:hypothetical protein